MPSQAWALFCAGMHCHYVARSGICAVDLPSRRACEAGADLGGIRSAGGPLGGGYTIYLSFFLTQSSKLASLGGRRHRRGWMDMHSAGPTL
jgi:hypothetical protein